MSASTAIGMVGESLKNLLEGEMQILPKLNVTLLTPDEQGGGNRRVNLFLYKVQQNPFFINADWQVKRDEPTKISPPPLSVNLFYLMTACAQNDSETGNVPAHDILGEAMRVFYENSIVSKKYLVDGLKETTEQIKIIQSPLDMDELGRVWSTFSQPLRLSVLYEISVVQIDQQAIKERVIAKRVRKIGIMQPEAPFQPPTIEQIAPQSGPAGTEIKFTGKNLGSWKANVTIIDGDESSVRELTWKANVTIGGESLPQGLALTDNTFTATIPTDLPAGFYQMQVDISGLFRKTFFFEVTA